MGVLQDGMRDGIKHVITLMVVFIFLALIITIGILLFQHYFDARKFIEWLIF